MSPENSERPPAARESVGARLWRRPRRWWLLGIPLGGLLAFVVGIAFWASFITGTHYAETNEFCTSCHEMNTAFQEYTQSVHYSNPNGVRATCGDCHVPPTFFAGLMRHAAASKEVWGHLTGKLDTPAKYESLRSEMAQKIWLEFKANDSAECRSCHTAAAMDLASQPKMAARSHASMAKSGDTCIDCHKGVAHKLPEGVE